MSTKSTHLSYYDKSKLPSAASFTFGLVVSEWNDEITNALLEGCLSTLKDLGAKSENIITWKVPGSFELVYGSKKMITTHDVDAVISIGCVIRGETSHFDYICQGVSQGISSLNLNYEIPVIFCVLTDNSLQQSKDRSGGKHGNKGVEAAISALKMVTLAKK